MEDFGSEILSKIEERDNPRKRRIINLFVIYALVFVLAIASSFAISNYVLSMVKVNGESMEPTLSSGDVLFVNKVKKVQIEDVIIIKMFVGTDYEKLYIKRVYGFEGDAVWAKDGVVYREYTSKGQRKVQKFTDAKAKKTADFPKQIVPKGCIFFLGDNRGNSQDSRWLYSQPKANVVGVVTGFSIKYKKTITKFFDWYVKEKANEY